MTRDPLGKRLAWAANVVGYGGTLIGLLGVLALLLGGVIAAAISDSADIDVAYQVLAAWFFGCGIVGVYGSHWYHRLVDRHPAVIQGDIMTSIMRVAMPATLPIMWFLAVLANEDLRSTWLVTLGAVTTGICLVTLVDWIRTPTQLAPEASSSDESHG